MDFIHVITVLSFFFFVFFLYIKNRYAYWSKRKIPHLKKKKHFLLGHFGETLFNGIPLIKVHEKWYNELSSYKFGGIFHFSTPILIVRDPELIKNICTKDFDYFINRLDNELDENEPFALNLFGLRGQKWKILRSKLTPTFTSGKMKLMFHIIKEYNRELVKMIDKMNMEKDVHETKELMARYTTDIISSCIFGLQSNSQNDPNSVFRCMGKKIFNFSLRNLITTIVQDISPKIRKILGMNIIEKNIIEFFSSIVKNNIKYREENNVNKNDFIDLLISLKKEKILNFKVNEDTEVKMEFTDDALTAQCFFFYLAGSETTAGALTFALYEIAKHGDIQNILFNEVEKIIDEYEELTYESLQKMTYLEEVINETLRMYPIAPFLMRVCNKDYLLDDDTMIEKGTRIIIPIMGLHHDPQYYENPTEFNPENFSKEAKEQRHRYVYLPFGEGPRNCIGIRFALMQIKLGLVTIIKNYKISLSPKMNGPLMFRKFILFTETKDGMWLTFSKRI